ncbi:serine palmitoyltransferase small subunit B isoform X1 [Neopsephotus bourkii]|uniref:serine palmitoyltransferase small subunit B isoform X1 n=2 Tax=Neopsephotus bourkii TaxID=309878 RepID=UPI002AA4FF09|nr:serine palmitoyltransferase small subunit B isoform X1 [Neopsephotus bourkii]
MPSALVKHITQPLLLLRRNWQCCNLEEPCLVPLPDRSSSQNHWKLKMDIKHVKDYIYWLYYQYLLITCSYVLEPWERSMFHTITVTVFAMVVYTAYVFVPIHVRLAFEFFSQLFGGQPESTVSIMN